MGVFLIFDLTSINLTEKISKQRLKANATFKVTQPFQIEKCKQRNEKLLFQAIFSNFGFVFACDNHFVEFTEK